MERRRKDAEDSWREARRLVGPLGRWRLKRLLPRIKELMGLGELYRSELIRLMAAVRRHFLELARRWVEAGRLDAADELWHLSIDEVTQATWDPGLDLHRLVRLELAKRAAWGRFRMPLRMADEEILPLPDVINDPVPASARMKGTALSPGLAEGPARVVPTLDEAWRLSPGEVLVALATEPGWTPLFTRAAAVVVELGGTLSHAGIIAREFGDPGGVQRAGCHEAHPRQRSTPGGRDAGDCRGVRENFGSAGAGGALSGILIDLICTEALKQHQGINPPDGRTAPCIPIRPRDPRKASTYPPSTQALRFPV